MTTVKYSPRLAMFVVIFDENCPLLAAEVWTSVNFLEIHFLSLVICSGHLISRFGDIPGPLPSLDLPAPDFFLWGHLQEREFRSRPQIHSRTKE
jgi:hypothetical protein